MPTNTPATTEEHGRLQSFATTVTMMTAIFFRVRLESFITTLRHVSASLKHVTYRSTTLKKRATTYRLSLRSRQSSKYSNGYILLMSVAAFHDSIHLTYCWHSKRQWKTWLSIEDGKCVRSLLVQKLDFVVSLLIWLVMKVVIHLQLLASITRSFEFDYLRLETFKRYNNGSTAENRIKCNSMHARAHGVQQMLGGHPRPKLTLSVDSPSYRCQSNIFRLLLFVVEFTIKNEFYSYRCTP